MDQLGVTQTETLEFCSNIRNSILKGVEWSRIKGYSDWYWINHLKPHVEDEERLIFSILGKVNPLVKRAIAEHRRLQRHFESSGEIYKMLSRIEEELSAHVRFENHVLFKEIERQAGPTGADAIKEIHLKHNAESVWSDEFWKLFRYVYAYQKKR